MLVPVITGLGSWVRRKGTCSSKSALTPDNKEFRRKESLGFLSLCNLHSARLQAGTGHTEVQKTDVLPIFMRLRAWCSCLLWELQNSRHCPRLMYFIWSIWNHKILLFVSSQCLKIGIVYLKLQISGFSEQIRRFGHSRSNIRLTAICHRWVAMFITNHTSPCDFPNGEWCQVLFIITIFFLIVALRGKIPK